MWWGEIGFFFLVDLSWNSPAVRGVMQSCSFPEVQLTIVGRRGTENVVSILRNLVSVALHCTSAIHKSSSSDTLMLPAVLEDCSDEGGPSDGRDVGKRAEREEKRNKGGAGCHAGAAPNRRVVQYRADPRQRPSRSLLLSFFLPSLVCTLSKAPGRQKRIY